MFAMLFERDKKKKPLQTAARGDFCMVYLRLQFFVEKIFFTEKRKTKSSFPYF